MRKNILTLVLLLFIIRANAQYYSDDFRTRINFGIGYASFSDLPIDERFYTPLEDHLKQGVEFGFSFTHYFADYFGVGLKSSFYNSNTVQRTGNALPSVSAAVPSGTVPAYYKNTLFVPYIGPVISLHHVGNVRPNELMLNYSFGFMRSFHSASGDNNFEDHVRSDIVGNFIDLSYSFSIYERYLLGLELSYFRACLLKEQADQWSEDYELFMYPKVSRFELSLKLGYKL